MDFKTVIDKLYDIEYQKLVDANPGKNVTFSFKKETAGVLAVVYNMIALLNGKTDGLAGFGRDGQPIKVEVSSAIPAEEKKRKDKKSSETLNPEGGNGSDEGNGTDD
jgi:hypothetical protein